MLVLSRKKGETVYVSVGGVEVEVCVVDIRGDKVRIGFEAPKDVTVLRSEVREEGGKYVCG